MNILHCHFQVYLTAEPPSETFLAAPLLHCATSRGISVTCRLLYLLSTTRFELGPPECRLNMPIYDFASQQSNAGSHYKPGGCADDGQSEDERVLEFGMTFGVIGRPRYDHQ
jgi:hypothetical protein